uniref:Uncharacterized protein n=1 Tax=Anguilla anguilla TaxID=7936 RepID=A0A0E9Q6W8_ANGAN
MTQCVWDYLDREKPKMQPTFKTQLWRCLYLYKYPCGTS